MHLHLGPTKKVLEKGVLQHNWAFPSSSQSRGCKLVACRTNSSGQTGVLWPSRYFTKSGDFTKTRNSGLLLKSQSIMELKSPHGQGQVASPRGTCSPPAYPLPRPSADAGCQLSFINSLMGLIQGLYFQKNRREQWKWRIILFVEHTHKRLLG